jgi:hypothetical protein
MFGSNVRLGEWLRSGDKIYWIGGKAGSGKFTLMKFLCDHPHTKQELCEWAGQKQVVMASFLFWITGNEIQKSQNGLFQSLLFEILRQCPSIIMTLCKSRWEENTLTNSPPVPWTRTELLEAFHELGTNCVSSKFSFFIDGLGEYEGDHCEVIAALNDLSSSSVEICVSSRPWNVFEDAFGQEEERCLHLEQLTHSDIRVYFQNKLEENHHFVALRR